MRNKVAWQNNMLYAPLNGNAEGIERDNTGLGSCKAQWGKIVMDGPVQPRDVKTHRDANMQV